MFSSPYSCDYYDLDNKCKVILQHNNDMESERFYDQWQNAQAYINDCQYQHSYDSNQMYQYDTTNQFQRFNTQNHVSYKGGYESSVSEPSLSNEFNMETSNMYQDNCKLDAYRSTAPVKKSKVKKERTRVYFTPEQVVVLKEEYMLNLYYLPKTRYKYLMKTLALSKLEIRNWFKNRRARYKMKVKLANS